MTTNLDLLIRTLMSFLGDFNPEILLLLSKKGVNVVSAREMSV